MHLIGFVRYNGAAPQYAAPLLNPWKIGTRAAGKESVLLDKQIIKHEPQEMFEVLQMRTLTNWTALN